MDLLSYVYPRTCVVCDRALSKKEHSIKKDVCIKCYENIKYIEEPICKKCGKQLFVMEEEYCHDCKEREHLFEYGLGLFQYDFIKEAIYRFKYNDHRLYGEFFGDEIGRRYSEKIKKWNADVIMPVPIHKKRLKKRGYNQAEIISKNLGKYMNIPVDKYSLKRIKNTCPQKKLSNNLRYKNVENAFKTYGNIVEYKNVILVDDIYTTGSTIDECARELLKAGVSKVYFVTICIGDGI